jgi:hypothetical protein
MYFLPDELAHIGQAHSDMPVSSGR